jgi:hypothetical protein
MRARPLRQGRSFCIVIEYKDRSTKLEAFDHQILAATTVPFPLTSKCKVIQTYWLKDSVQTGQISLLLF